MKTTRLVHTSLLLAAGLLLSATSGSAALYYRVTIDTSVLNLPANSGNSPFSLDFQFNSGDTTGNNTAIISNFSFTGPGGAPFGAANLIGGASGSLPGAITLTDTDAFNEFYQSFTPGTMLEFDLNLTQNVDAGLTPDSFSIAILDGTLSNIDTNGFGNTLFQVDIDTTSPIPVSEVILGNGTGTYSGLTTSAIPEPGSAMLGLIACGLGIFRRRRAA